jgi:hypothetical protein
MYMDKVRLGILASEVLLGLACSRVIGVQLRRVCGVVPLGRLSSPAESVYSGEVKTSNVPMNAASVDGCEMRASVSCWMRLR